MTEKPLVSVIINCYNGEKYLREAIDSVMAQTYENWELVFWDNQSTDSTREIVESYGDPRIHYIYAPEHTSLGAARNYALQEVKGVYVCFLDADDVWAQSFLYETVYVLINKPQIGMVYVGYNYIGHKKGVHESGMAGERDFASLLENYDVAISGALFRKNIIDSHSILFDTSFSLIEDLDFYSRICYIKPAYRIVQPLLFYRIHGDNLSSKTTNWYAEYEGFYHRLCEIAKNDTNINKGLRAIKYRMHNARFTDSFNANNNFFQSFIYAIGAHPLKLKLLFVRVLLKRKLGMCFLKR